jgi:hypothetical protein
VSFEEILASLGETGESGESPCLSWVTAEAKKGEFAPVQKARANGSPPFAPYSPCPEPAPAIEIRPIRPIRPAEADEIVRLIKICGTHYGFTEQEFSEAITSAMNDIDSALTCYQAIAAELGVALNANSERR